MNLKEEIKKFPDSPGIYLFYSKKELVYIGKATSLKRRVASYFMGKRTNRPIEAMINEVDSARYRETDSVIEAIILEANYIKKYQPKYNVKEKDNKSWNYLALTREDFPKLEAVREHILKEMGDSVKKSYKHVFGPFPSMKTKEVLKILHNLFCISRCGPNQKRPCFDYQIGHCMGVCCGEVNKSDYRDRVIKPLVYFLNGKKKTLLLMIERNMKKSSDGLDFEEAKRLRDQLNALKRIRDISLLDKSFVNDYFDDKDVLIRRFEGYDISNMGEDAKVGSMVVFNGKGAMREEYKKFKIKTVIGQSDVDCLKEVLSRRFKHDDWKLPDLVLVDGGKPQVSIAENVLIGFNLDIPVIGIAKGAERKKNEFIFNDIEDELVQWISDNENLLIQARDEAHRFAISYQRQLLRKKDYDHK
ncbi:MAG: GIY-YIG nuclease family protein [Candidatus Pacebacteria bacterium]|nr:GIY-YIG nuclease family protein [Candidatus Paceibacterota bacterium]